MTGHLFLGGPVHGEWHDLPGSPSRWEVPVYPEMPVWLATTNVPSKIEQIEVTRFVYEPRIVRKVGGVLGATVYVPAHLDEAAQWEMVKALGLGEVPEG